MFFAVTSLVGPLFGCRDTIIFRQVKVESADEIAGFSALDEDEQQQVIDAVEGVEDEKERIKAERAAARKAKAKVKVEKKVKAENSPAKRKKAGKKTTVSPKKVGVGLTVMTVLVGDFVLEDS